MPYPSMTDAQLRKAMHQFGLTKSGAARKPKAQRRRYAGASARVPSAATSLAIRKAAGEKKGVDIIIGDGTTVPADVIDSDQFFVPNLIAPGSGSMNRVGRKIFCKSLRVFGTVTLRQSFEATTGDFYGNTFRMMVVWDKQPSGALPIFSDIFAATPQSGTDASTTMSLPRYDNMSRFQVLRDVRISADALSPSNLGTTNETQREYSFDEYIKLGNRQTVYGADNATAVIGDISSGGLYVIFRARLETGGTNTWFVNTGSMARLRYSD